MTDETRLLVEQDPTLARLAETSLRMMAGTVGAGTQRAVQEALRASPESYPWQRVCDLVVAEAVDPSALANGAIVSQRDWVQRDFGPRGGARTPATGARPRRPASNAFKRLIAIAIVRGGFYTVFAAAFVAILVLIERKWGFDIYAAGRAVEEFARGLFGA